jgi:hypothetical protein
MLMGQVWGSDMTHVAAAVRSDSLTARLSRAVRQHSDACSLRVTSVDNVSLQLITALPAVCSICATFYTRMLFSHNYGFKGAVCEA